VTIGPEYIDFPEVADANQFPSDAESPVAGVPASAPLEVILKIGLHGPPSDFQVNGFHCLNSEYWPGDFRQVTEAEVSFVPFDEPALKLPGVENGPGAKVHTLRGELDKIIGNANVERRDFGENEIEVSGANENAIPLPRSLVSRRQVPAGFFNNVRVNRHVIQPRYLL